MRTISWQSDRCSSVSPERSLPNNKTVKQRLDGKPLIDSFDKVTHTFNEEKPVLVTIAAVGLKFPNSRESERNF
ncbi:MAG TPA: hypothetical protein VFT48_06910 [Pyrinomonadaceae bacterium]|nr:hypothetical protein [Pyrinomonadaceae bacterium]